MGPDSGCYACDNSLVAASSSENKNPDSEDTKFLLKDGAVAIEQVSKSRKARRWSSVFDIPLPSFDEVDEEAEEVKKIAADNGESNSFQSGNVSAEAVAGRRSARRSAVRAHGRFKVTSRRRSTKFEFVFSSPPATVSSILSGPQRVTHNDSSKAKRYQKKEKHVRISKELMVVDITPLPDKEPGKVRMPCSPPLEENDEINTAPGANHTGVIKFASYELEICDSEQSKEHSSDAEIRSGISCRHSEQGSESGQISEETPEVLPQTEDDEDKGVRIQPADSFSTIADCPSRKLAVPGNLQVEEEVEAASSVKVEGDNKETLSSLSDLLDSLPVSNAAANFNRVSFWIRFDLKNPQSISDELQEAASGDSSPAYNHTLFEPAMEKLKRASPEKRKYDLFATTTAERKLTEVSGNSRGDQMASKKANEAPEQSDSRFTQVSEVATTRIRRRSFIEATKRINDCCKRRSDHEAAAVDVDGFAIASKGEICESVAGVPKREGLQ